MRGACPALVIGGGEVSGEEEKISAWRGLRTMEERDSWGGSRVTPEGVNLFPKENLCKLLFAPNFTFTFISESEIRPFHFLFMYSMQQHVTRA